MPCEGTDARPSQSFENGTPAAEPAQAVGSLLPPQHQAPLRISFAEFSGAVDRALDGSGASGGGGDGGARTGELYCRKLLTHWEPEPSLSW